MDYKETSFQDYCGKLYSKKLAESLKVEIDNPEKYPQEAFTSCEQRTEAVGFEARKYVGKFQTLTDVLHRESKHGEKYEEEKAIASVGLAKEDIEAANYYASSWWGP